MELAGLYNFRLFPGGDRHGCEPNANLNMTNAGTFSEFVAEIRSGASHVLFMPQYREAMFLRQLATAWDILRDYPEYTGRRIWSDPIHFRHDHGTFKPLTTAWSTRR